MSTCEVTKRGRPLVFLATLAIAWIGLRLLFIASWPDAHGATLTQVESAAQEAQRSQGPR